MTATHLTDFEQWVARNATPRLQSRVKSTTDVMADLTSAAAGQPVVTGSKLVGADAAQALQSDQAYVSARNANNLAAAQQQLAVSPATGCAMCLSLAQNASGYNPASPTAAGNLAGFQAYVQEVMACPIFSATVHDTVNVSWQSDWSSMVNQIVNFYVGISDDEKSTIWHSLWTLARAAASNPNTNQTENLFVQNTLNSNSGALNVYIYKSFVAMSEEVHQGSGKNAPTVVTNQASFTLYRTVLSFETANWPAYSKIIMPKTTANLNSWLTNNSTPQGTVPVNWNC